MTRILALLTPILLAAVVCGGSSAQAREPTGSIAFIRGSKLWVMRADGSGQRALPTGRYPENPAWSHDGRTIAFGAWDRDTYTDLYAINAGGSGLRRLTRHRVDAVEPVWSPDGRKIALDEYYDGTYAIWVMNANGTGERRATPGFRFTGPTWSPDSRRIAFVHRDTGNVYVMNRDGSGRRVLVRMGGTSFPYAHAWSPAGRHIALIHDGHLWVMNADGTRPRRLADPRIEKPGRREGDLAWSPDGRKIAFVVREGRGPRGDPDVDFDIFVVNSDWSGLRNLTKNDRVLDQDPVWSPDGRAIAFTSDRDGNSEIYVMNADGSGERNLSRSRLEDLEPAWSPTR